VEIKNKKSFNDLITSLTEEILDEEDLDEMTTTNDVGGYNTPMAFDPEGEKRKKKYKKDYKKVNEGIDEKDLVMIKKLVRKVIANVLRDIWIKRASWK
jgi:hypothetical protein